MQPFTYENSLVDHYVALKSKWYKNIDISSLFDRSQGFAVVPLPHRIIDEFDVHLFLREQREFKNNDPNQLFVLGGFQALGNPSSFHHPERRKLMYNIYKFVAPLIAESIVTHPEYQDDYAYLSMIPDRFAIRRTDQQMGSETWHKDKSMHVDQSAHSFLIGGWVNLDKESDQYFSCIPGEFPLFQETHEYYTSQLSVEGGGFTSEKSVNEANKIRVTIPPYHIILFNELLTHEVVKGPSKRTYDATKNSYRCYLKWYISSKDVPYWDAERFSNFIQDQTQIGMSYFQSDAPMYASAHTSTGISTLQQFSSQLIEDVKHFQFKDQAKYPGTYVDRFIGQGNKTAPDSKGFVRREGLKDWGLEFESYSTKDLSIYSPRLML